MDFNKLISKRLGGEMFYQNSYYKFEKYSTLKNEYLNNHADIELLDFGIGEGDDMPPSFALDRLSNEIFKYENRVYSDNGITLFKEKAAKHLKDIYDLEIEDYNKNINHIMGAKSALTILPIALVNDDDVIISTIPGYEVLYRTLYEPYLLHQDVLNNLF